VLVEGRTTETAPELVVVPLLQLLKAYRLLKLYGYTGVSTLRVCVLPEVQVES